MFEKIRSSVKRLLSLPLVDEKAIEDAIRDIQRALILADVDIRLVVELSEKIRKKVKEAKEKDYLSAKEVVLKVVYDELLRILGGKEKPRILTKGRILVMGLYGQGKTTTVAKLARYYQKRGFKVGIICCDIHRAAAYEQIKQLVEKYNIETFFDEDLEKCLKEGLAKFSDKDIIIIDSAGRDSFKEDLVEELRKINEIAKPDEKILVISADIGQSARKHIEAFSDAVGIDGIIITKMDSSAKGGGALAAAYLCNARVKFIGTGEKIDDIEEFDAERYLRAMLGFADIEGLLRKIRELEGGISEEEILKGKFTLKTFYKQLQTMQKIGPLKQVMQMIGLVNLPEEAIKVSEEKLRKFKYIMDSMRRVELENPEIIDYKRMQRIAKGSGTTVKDVKELLQYYNQTKKLMKMAKSERRLRRFLRKFGLDLQGAF